MTRFDEAVDDVLSAGPGTSGFVLAYGQAGRGKSVAADRYCTQRSGVHMRVWEGWSQTSFMQRLLFEIRARNGDMPRHTGNRCKEYIVDLLDKERKPIFVDEADRLAMPRIEDLHDIHEMTGAPIVLIGEEGLIGLLSERRRIWSRVAYEVEFTGITAPDVALYAMQAAGLKITAELCQAIVAKSEGDFRLVRNVCLLLERAAKARGDFTPDREMVDTVLSSKSWRRK